MQELNFYKFTEKITIKIFVNPKIEYTIYTKMNVKKTRRESSKKSKDGNILRVSLQVFYKDL